MSAVSSSGSVCTYKYMSTRMASSKHNPTPEKCFSFPRNEEASLKENLANSKRSADDSLVARILRT